MNVKALVTIDPDILGGQPLFTGTRVPVACLFDHLQEGIPLDEFLQNFPSVPRMMAVAVLEMACKLVTSKNMLQLYETAG